MKASNIPERVQLPWANAAGPSYKNAIPTASQIGITAGLASLTDGFPPITFLDEGAGGQPPFGADFNGILNLISGNTRWGNAGAFYPYDSTFSTYIGGYPIGSVLVRADGTGFWLSTIDDNTNNPETTGTGWVPINNQGATAIAGLTNANVTLTPAQYSKKQIVLSGTLTGNMQITFPAFVGQDWEIINNCVMAGFTITCKTASGSGASIFMAVQTIGCDGTNIIGLGNPNGSFGVASGTASAIAVGITPAVKYLPDGFKVRWKSTVAANPGATLSVNGLPAVTLLNQVAQALTLGLIQVGSECEATYNAGSNRFILTTPNANALSATNIAVGAGNAPTGTQGSHGYYYTGHGTIVNWTTVQLDNRGTPVTWTYDKAFPSGTIGPMSAVNLAALSGQGTNPAQAIINFLAFNLANASLSVTNPSGTNSTWFFLAVEGY